MTKKKPTRIERSTSVLSNSKDSKWCYVNTDNEFTYNNNIYVIDEDVEDYKVYNRAGEVEDYTNEAFMEEILVVAYTVDEKDELKFYSQSFEEVEKELVRVKG